MDDRRVGRLFREVRIHRGWRQRDLAERAGVSAAQISATERGRLEHVSLHALRKLGDALDIRVSIDPWWRAGRADQLLDRAHAALVDHVAGLLRDAGWDVLVEFTFNEYGDRGSVDILAWHAGTRTLLLVEVKSRIDDLQEAARSFMVKVRVVPKAVEREHGWQPATVSRVLAIIDTHANRALVGEHAATFDSIWAGRTAAVRRHIREPAAPLGGGIMFVPAGRLGPAARTVARVRQRRAA